MLSTQYVVVLYWKYFLMLFCCFIILLLFSCYTIRSIAIVPSVFRCSASASMFRQRSGVPSVFRQCSASVLCSIVPGSGVPGFIVCRLKERR